MTEYQRYYWNKGGTPNQMFIMKNEYPRSENVDLLTKQLQTYHYTQNKWKSMVVTTNKEGLEVVDLNKPNKDMEFRELAEYIIINISPLVPHTQCAPSMSPQEMSGNSDT